MNPEHSLELSLKRETAFSETSDGNFLKPLDPLMDIKVEEEVFCESNEDDEYSYETNSALIEKGSPTVAYWEKSVLNVEGNMPRINPEHSLEFPLKSETEGALSHPSINQEKSDMAAACSETSDGDFLSLDPLMDIKAEEEVFCESNEDDEYSYEMNSVVNEKDPLTCKKEVKQERRNSHNGEKPFRSTDCEKAFYKKINLTSHITNPTREKTFICNECGKAFSRKDNLTDHMRIHTGEKPFMCKECGKAFSQKPNLTTHMRIHTGV